MICIWIVMNPHGLFQFYMTRQGIILWTSKFQINFFNTQNHWALYSPLYKYLQNGLKSCFDKNDIGYIFYITHISLKIVIVTVQKIHHSVLTPLCQVYTNVEQDLSSRTCRSTLNEGILDEHCQLMITI